VDIGADSFITIEAEQTSGGVLEITANRWVKLQRVGDL